MNNFLKNHYLALHGIIFLWGFTGILGRVISISSTAIVWWRILIALAGLLGFMVFSGRKLHTSSTNRVKYLLTGVVIAAHWAFFFEALKVSNVSITLTTLASGSLFVAILEPLFFKRRIIGYEILFGLITIAALALIFQVESGYSQGIVLALISASMSALFGTLNGVYVRTDRPTVITVHELLGGLIGISLYILIVHGFDGFEMPVGIDWLYLLLLGLVCTSFALAVSVKVMQVLSPFTVSISINMEPIYAILFALLLFREKEFMSPMFYLGAVIVLSMIFLNSYMKRKQV